LRRSAISREETRGDLDTLGAVTASRADLPLEALTREELGERIRCALQQLPEAQREAFLLKEEGALDFGAVGAILSCGRETAKSRFRLAVGKLRTLLELDSPAARKGVDD
jgi:RNA polymerase sigma-70 factor (ECF subfamily)